MLKLILLAIGVGALIGLVWHIGPGAIAATIVSLGPGAVLAILVPSLIVYLLEAVGWRWTLGQHALRVGFGRLFAIRMAGEAINASTPAAYVGGEPLKAYLLKSYGVPMVEGLASAITAKTIMTLAQIVFMGCGLVLSVWLLDLRQGTFLAALGSLTLLVVGVSVFVLVQRRGLGASVLALFRHLRIKVAALDRHRDKLLTLDQVIQGFYRNDRRAFGMSFLAFFLGWVTETLEVYAILYFLAVPIDVLTALCLAALTMLIKGGTFFIPGSLGAQEGGYLLLLLTFGYTELTGITFALIRRLREVVWILVGLGCLVAVRGRGAMAWLPHGQGVEKTG